MDEEWKVLPPKTPLPCEHDFEGSMMLYTDPLQKQCKKCENLFAFAECFGGCKQYVLRDQLWCSSCYHDYKEDPDAFK